MKKTDVKLPIPVTEDCPGDGMVCPVCRKKFKRGNCAREFFAIDGGCMIECTYESRLYEKKGIVTAFNSFIYHGGDHRYVSFSVVSIKDDVNYELQFCSLECLKRWINHCLEAFENAIEEEKEREEDE